MSELEYTSTGGLRIQTFEQIVDANRSRFRTRFRDRLKTDPVSVAGQIIHIFAEQRAVDQQALADVVNAFDPDAAEGAALEALSSVTGTDKRGALRSTVRGVLTFNAEGEPVADGFLLRNEGQQTAWVTVNGPYASPPGGGDVTVTLRAVDFGPLVAPAGSTWTTIPANPTVDGFTNPTEDASIGRYEESDPALRRRRAVEVRATGVGSLAAIKAAVSRVSTDDGEVLFAAVSHNPRTSPVDDDGVPWKAFRVVVETSPESPPAGLVQAIIDAIGPRIGLGGQAWGTDHVGTYTDREGNVHEVGFDVIDYVDAYVCIEVTTAAAISGADLPIVPADRPTMATMIRDAAVAEQATLRERGRDVIPLDYEAIVGDLRRTGDLRGVYRVRVGLSLASKDDAQANLGVDVHIPIGPGQRADIDSGEIRIIIDGNVVLA